MAAASGAAAAAAIAEAIKASGTIVKVEPDVFAALVARAQSPLVVAAPGGFFAKKYRYLTSYKGLAFTTDSDTALPLPPEAEIIAAAKIWLPQ